MRYFEHLTAAARCLSVPVMFGSVPLFAMTAALKTSSANNEREIADIQRDNANANNTVPNRAQATDARDKQ